MLCPFCGNEDTQVKDSRPAEDGAAIRRRRLCSACESRFTTFERVQLREITIVKRSGRKSVFERDKLERSFQVALRKREVDPDTVAKAINEIVRKLEGHSDGVYSVAFNNDGSRIVSGSKDNMIRVWDTSIVKCLTTLRGH